MTRTYEPERFETVVIGAGQAGLSVGYHLARRGRRFVILDAHDRVGDVWRKRWDSLHLFSPAEYDGLDGMPFPAPTGSFPHKNQMADYLESYAARFALPVRTGVRVTRVTRRGSRYLIESTAGRIEADHVVVAMSTYQHAKVPAYARELDGSIVQMHSTEYQNPRQLKPGGVLIVGAGNSGAEIALELARAGHPIWVSGPDVGAVPFDIQGLAARLFLRRLVFRVVFHRLLTLSTPIGRKARFSPGRHRTPLIRTKRRDLTAVGVEFVERTAGARGGRPLLTDGRVLDATNVIWCTGFDAGLSWLDLPLFDADGAPREHRGVVPDEPGFYFVGRDFQYAMSSTMIHGVGRDADYVAGVIDGRARTVSLHPEPVAMSA
jgi:putative flavoprotein involved in K+ transport